MYVLKECQSCARDWEHRLEEGLKLWRHLQEKAKPLENWISSAEHALNSSSTDNNLVELSVCAKPVKILRVFYSKQLNFQAFCANSWLFKKWILELKPWLLCCSLLVDLRKALLQVILCDAQKECYCTESITFCADNHFHFDSFSGWIDFLSPT